jgi:hypothetical protein
MVEDPGSIVCFVLLNHEKGKEGRELGAGSCRWRCWLETIPRRLLVIIISLVMVC